MPNKNQLDCNKGKWVEIQLIDEFGDGKAYSNLSFEITFADKTKKNYTLDNNGFRRLENIPCGKFSIIFRDTFSETSYPVNRKIKDQELIGWYNHLIKRGVNITSLQVSAEQALSSGKLTYTPSNSEANSKPTDYHNIEVIDLVDNKDHLIRNFEWIKGKSYSTIAKEILLKDSQNDNKNNNNPSKKTPYEEFQKKYPIDKEEEERKRREIYNPKQKIDGAIDVRPKQRAEMLQKKRENQKIIQYQKKEVNNTTTGFLTGKKHILRIRALRSYRPLLSLNKELSILNLYQLATLADLSYEDFEVIKNTFSKWSAHEQVDYKGYYLLQEDIPYSKRFQIDHKSTNFLLDDGTNTQGFITHNDKILLISIRGTDSHIGDDSIFDSDFVDAITDLNIPQTPFTSNSSVKVHTGFNKAFDKIKESIDNYIGLNHTDQTIVITGHSLGGAIATLIATWLQTTKPFLHNKIILYTYGSPRVGDSAFVTLAKEVIHHRVVNNLDPVPYIPFPWLKDESFEKWAERLWKIIFPVRDLFDKKTNLPYTHQGKLQHLIPLPDKLINNAFLTANSMKNDLSSYYLEVDQGLPKSRPNLAFTNPSDHFIDNYKDKILKIFKRWRTSYLNKSSKASESEIKVIQSDIKSQKDNAGKLQSELDKTSYQPTFPIALKAAKEIYEIYKINKFVVDTKELIANEERVKLNNESVLGIDLYGSDVFTDFSDKKIPLQDIVNQWMSLTK